VHPIETPQPVERSARHRPGDHVTTHHDRVRLFALDLLEHGLERGQVAVDVVQRRDAQASVLG
jgi:hypothetical protein